jgi:hypothetical protein
MTAGRPIKPTWERQQDDALTIYAQAKKAVVVTHDREFSARRRRNTIGLHIFLDCLEPDAVDLMEQHLDDIVEALESRMGISSCGCRPRV